LIPDDFDYETFQMIADSVREKTHRSIVNESFDRSVLFFEDGSSIRFEHTSRDNRWAKASGEATMAEDICLAIAQFRLNAKHLELFFEDGSSVEFHPTIKADNAHNQEQV